MRWSLAKKVAETRGLSGLSPPPVGVTIIGNTFRCCRRCARRISLAGSFSTAMPSRPAGDHQLPGPLVMSIAGEMREATTRVATHRHCGPAALVARVLPTDDPDGDAPQHGKLSCAALFTCITLHSPSTKAGWRMQHLDRKLSAHEIPDGGLKLLVLASAGVATAVLVVAAILAFLHAAHAVKVGLVEQPSDHRAAVTTPPNCRVTSVMPTE